MKSNKLQHVINVSPATEYIDTLPKSFIERLERKNKIQNKKFRIFLIPLSHRQYKIFSGNKYSSAVIIAIFNDHLIMEDVSVSYVIKWPLLVKLIIDTVFTISGDKLEEMNAKPQILFDMLSNYRNAYSTIESLVDRLVINTQGMEMYMKFQQLETIEERLAFVSLVEMSTDVIIEERYLSANSLNKPINLNPSKEFRKEYNGRTGVNELIDEAQADLRATMKRDEKLNRLGVTRKINTSNENKDLADL